MKYLPYIVISILGVVALILIFRQNRTGPINSTEVTNVVPTGSVRVTPTSGRGIPDESTSSSESSGSAKIKGTATMQFDANKKYTATLKTTKGDITVELNNKATPNTVGNFVKLANSLFYNNTIFHRVIKGFMIQGGDPKGDGTGGPGYTFPDEPFSGEYLRGTIAMANAGPNTNGSQFFIMHKDYPLPRNYVIFGHVIKGIEVVDIIAESPVSVSTAGENSKPVEPTIIKSIEVNEN